MITKFLSETTIIAIITLSITACSSQGTDKVRLAAPDYASRTGAESYTVQCGGGADITIRRTSMDSFYHENGSQKTYDEFCAEFNPNSLLRK